MWLSLFPTYQSTAQPQFIVHPLHKQKMVARSVGCLKKSIKLGAYTKNAEGLRIKDL